MRATDLTHNINSPNLEIQTRDGDRVIDGHTPLPAPAAAARANRRQPAPLTRRFREALPRRCPRRSPGPQHRHPFEAFRCRAGAARSRRHPMDAGQPAGERRAFSTRGRQPGIDPLGVQTDDPAGPAAMKAGASAADMTLLRDGQATCCCAGSEKHWITDPQGIAWEPSTSWEHPRVQRSLVGRAGAANCCTPADEALKSSTSCC